MRTTLDISEALLIEAKQLAVARRTSLKAVVEDGLRALLHARLRDAPTGSGWPVDYDARPVPDVDLTSTSALLDRTEADPA